MIEIMDLCMHCTVAAGERLMIHVITEPSNAWWCREHMS